MGQLLHGSARTALLAGLAGCCRTQGLLRAPRRQPPPLCGGLSRTLGHGRSNPRKRRHDLDGFGFDYGEFWSVTGKVELDYNEFGTNYKEFGRDYNEFHPDYNKRWAGYNEFGRDYNECRPNHRKREAD